MRINTLSTVPIARLGVAGGGCQAQPPLMHRRWELILFFLPATIASCGGLVSSLPFSPPPPSLLSLLNNSPECRSGAGWKKKPYLQNPEAAIPSPGQNKEEKKKKRIRTPRREVPAMETDAQPISGGRVFERQPSYKLLFPSGSSH